MRTKRALFITLSASAFALLAVEPGFPRGDWPDCSASQWFKPLLKRPNGWNNPGWDERSRFCCEVADAVKTKFKLEKADRARYPEGAWYAWVKNKCVKILPETIVDGVAPNGERYVFLMAGTVQSLVRPRGGI